jgi:hypothetical protein
VSRFLGSNDLGAPYVLYGVVVHLDIMNVADFGHYVCFVRTPAATERALARAREDRAAGREYEAADSAARKADESAEDEWLRFDDDEITRVSARDVQRQKAYILFYQRSTPWVSEPLVAEEEMAAAAAADSSTPDAAGASAGAAEADVTVQCVGGCGFWGLASQQNRCSKCFRKWQVSQGLAPPPQPKPKPTATNRSGAQKQGEPDMQQAMAMMVMRQRMMQAARQKAEAEAAARAANAAGGSGRLGASQLGALADLAVGNSSSSSTNNTRTYRELEALQQRVAEARISDAKRAPPPPATAPAPVQTNPSSSPATAAATAQPVVTNGSSDEGAVSSGVRKQCASCMEEWPESDYSGAQLKKKGKRVCKHCVDKQATTVPAK